MKRAKFFPVLAAVVFVLFVFPVTVQAGLTLGWDPNQVKLLRSTLFYGNIQGIGSVTKETFL